MHGVQEDGNQRKWDGCGGFWYEWRLDSLSMTTISGHNVWLLATNGGNLLEWFISNAV